MPLPTARRAVPMAAVVLPLPGPVLISTSPRRDCSLDSVMAKSMARVIRMPRKDCKCPVDLLAEHHPRQLMWQGHGRKRKQQAGALAGRLRPAIRRTNGKDDTLPPFIAPSLQPLRKLL